jgi:hypothetical protein
MAGLERRILRRHLGSRRAGPNTGSTTFHCSSVSSQRPAIQICEDAFSNSGFADSKPQNVYEICSSENHGWKQGRRKF